MPKDSLTPKQRRFLSAYIISGNATESAKEAGYEHASAHVTGCRLLSNAKIKNRLEEIFKEEANISKAEFIKICHREFESSEGKSDRARFLDLAGRALGYLKNNEVSVQQVSVINQDDLKQLQSSRRNTLSTNDLQSTPTPDNSIT